MGGLFLLCWMIIYKLLKAFSQYLGQRHSSCFCFLFPLFSLSFRDANGNYIIMRVLIPCLCSSYCFCPLPRHYITPLVWIIALALYIYKRRLQSRDFRPIEIWDFCPIVGHAPAWYAESANRAGPTRGAPLQGRTALRPSRK